MMRTLQLLCNPVCKRVAANQWSAAWRGPSIGYRQISKPQNFAAKAVTEPAGGFDSEQFHEDTLMEMYATPVRRRVKKLEELLVEQEQVAAVFAKEQAELQQKFQSQYNVLYDQRLKIITGEVEVPDYGYEANADEKDEGIPDFWLTAMSNHDMLNAEISERDAEVLEYLSDIRSEVLVLPEEGALGYKLIFAFSENPFFTNKELTKTYILENGKEVIPKRFEGCRIDWLPGKNTTVKEVKKQAVAKGKKKASAAMVTKMEPCDSFFNFFNPIMVPAAEDLEEMEEAELDELQQALDKDYELGNTIKEQLIPDALDWFIGRAGMEDGGEDYLGDEDEFAEEDLEEEPPKAAPKGPAPKKFPGKA